jgi:hypothetical protein
VYEEEGVDWAHIPFVDNQEVLDLIDSRGGKQVSILSLLDEQCVFPRVSCPDGIINIHCHSANRFVVYQHHSENDESLAHSGCFCSGYCHLYDDPFPLICTWYIYYLVYCM